MYKIRSLQEFNFYEGTIEKASGIREKARQIIEMLGSNEILRNEREKARQLRNKFVGIDSRNAGYSGGNDSYYGGGGGGGGGGGSGGYGNSGIGSSYGNSGSGGGGGRYSDNDGPSRRASTGTSDFNRGSGAGGGGRYGGGAYDSDRPPRYGDDPADDRRSFTRDDARSSTNKYEDEPSSTISHVPKTSASKAKSSSTSSSGTIATGGKLKVNIKKSSDNGNNRSSAEKNLLETADIDLMGEPIKSSSVPSNDSFDAFASAPNNFPSVTPDFDPFGTSQPAALPNSAAAFDPFATAPVAPIQNNSFPYNQPQPVQNSNTFNAFPPQQQQQNNFLSAMPVAQPMQPTNNFGQPMQQMGGMNNFMAPQQQAPAPMMGGGGMNNGMGGFNNTMAPQQPLQTMQQPIQASNYQSHSPASKPNGGAPLRTYSHEAEFGDFEGPAAGSQQNRQQSQQQPDKWGDLGKLVDLNKIEKNNELMAKQNASSAAAHPNYANSFAGLDGFSKTPQSMVSCFIFGFQGMIFIDCVFSFPREVFRM
jgi:hypothetical protein